VNEKQIDNFLKEKARNEDLRLSLEVEKTISLAISNLPKNRGRRKPAIAIAIAAIVLISLMTLSIISPTYAKNLPVLKSVFDYFGKSGDYTNKQFSFYATPVNQSVTDKDYTVTVNEIAADDNFIVISYTVKGTKAFSKDFSSNPYLFGNLTQNGKLITNGTGRCDMLDEFTFAGYTAYFVGRNNIPEKLDFRYNVDHIGSTAGEWNFRITSSKQGTSKDSKVVSPNVTSTLPFANLKISKVVLSPFANTIMLNVSYSKQPYHYGFFVLDDNGKALYVIGEGQGGTGEQNVFFVKGKNELKKLTLIPFKYNPDYDLNPIQWLSKSTKSLPIVFSPGNETKITVKKIKSDSLGTKVYYTIEGQYPYGYAVKIVLFDDTGKEIFPRGNTEQLIDPETNEFVAEFDRLDEKKEYKVATPQLKDLIVLNENRISVPMK
jgi:hypothetical protein